MASDDQQLEQYLRQFRPLEAESLPFRPRRVSHLNSWRRRIAFAAAAVLLIGTGIWLDAHGKSNSPAQDATMVSDAGTSSRPLTIRRANAMLFGSSSISNGLNEMAFSQKPTLPVGTKSALHILGEEKTKI